MGEENFLKKLFFPQTPNFQKLSTKKVLEKLKSKTPSVIFLRKCHLPLHKGGEKHPHNVLFNPTKEMQIND